MGVGVEKGRERNSRCDKLKKTTCTIPGEKEKTNEFPASTGRVDASSLHGKKVSGVRMLEMRFCW